MINKKELMKEILKERKYTTKDDFSSYLKVIVKAIKNNNNSLNSLVKSVSENINNTMNSEFGRYNNNIANIVKEFDKKIAVFKEENIKLIKNLEAKIPFVKDGIDGKDADEENIVKKILEKRPEITAQAIRDLLESLDDDERLDFTAISGLEERLKKIERNNNLGGVSAFNPSSFSQHVIDDETPSGTVNGTNKDFTLNLTPSPTSSLKVFLNGQRMKITEDYTISGKTITFITAPLTGSIITCDYRV